MTVKYSVTVPGNGPVPCERMIVGEAGGENERNRGEPFVGDAGETLEDWLGLSGGRRQELYITNVFKGDVASGNPDPTREQLDDHFWLLALEIALVRPKAILSLGAVATRVLLPNRMPHASSRFQAVLGRSYRSPYAQARVFPCRHPAKPLTAAEQAAAKATVRRFLRY